MYLATSPDLFPLVCAQLGAGGLNGPNVRVVLEKPLGHDLASAREINRVVRSVFAEEQAFRIDHYLGKPAVQNLMALRFGNVLFEPLWRRECIANIQITLAESIGVGTRGDFYSRTGALRDMIQNHALQLLTMVAMEPPSRNDRRRDPRREAEGAALAQAVQRRERRPRRRARPVPRRQRRRQGRRGFLDEDEGAAGQHAPRPSSPCAPRCRTGAGRRVPFYLRTGKRLAERDAQIVVNFRRTPHSIFPGVNPPNKLVIKLQPEDGLELHLLAAKGAGQAEALSPVSLDLDFDKAFAENRVGAYERLLLDVIAGRLNLFVRSDEQEEAWALGRADPRSVAGRRRRPAPLRGRHLGPGGGERAGRARRLRLGGRAVAERRQDLEPSAPRATSGRGRRSACLCLRGRDLDDLLVRRSLPCTGPDASRSPSSRIARAPRAGSSAARRVLGRSWSSLVSWLRAARGAPDAPSGDLSRRAGRAAKGASRCGKSPADSAPRSPTRHCAQRGSTR